jgi:hypothetical protein
MHAVKQGNLTALIHAPDNTGIVCNNSFQLSGGSAEIFKYFVANQGVGNHTAGGVQDQFFVFVKISFHAAIVKSNKTPKEV